MFDAASSTTLSFIDSNQDHLPAGGGIEVSRSSVSLLHEACTDIVVTSHSHTLSHTYKNTQTKPHRFMDT